jgi:group I intron endonuclease
MKATTGPLGGVQGSATRHRDLALQKRDTYCMFPSDSEDEDESEEEGGQGETGEHAPSGASPRSRQLPDEKQHKECVSQIEASQSTHVVQRSNTGLNSPLLPDDRWRRGQSDELPPHGLLLQNTTTAKPSELFEGKVFKKSVGSASKKRTLSQVVCKLESKPNAKKSKVSMDKTDGVAKGLVERNTDRQCSPGTVQYQTTSGQNMNALAVNTVLTSNCVAHLAGKLVCCSQTTQKHHQSEKPGKYTEARYRAWDKANKKRSAANSKITHGIVYKLTSPSNKSYIGISKYSIERRILWHKNKRSGCKAIKSALKKYGFSSFKKEVLHNNIPLESLSALEMHEIDAHGTMAPNGYNLTRGGESNPMDEPATRKKISESKRVYWAAKGGGAEAATWMQQGDARARATATKLKRGWERAQGKASGMSKSEGKKYLIRFLRNRERLQKQYAKRKEQNVPSETSSAWRTRATSEVDLGEITAENASPVTE